MPITPAYGRWGGGQGHPPFSPYGVGQLSLWELILNHQKLKRIRKFNEHKQQLNPCLMVGVYLEGQAIRLWRNRIIFFCLKNHFLAWYGGPPHGGRRQEDCCELAWATEWAPATKTTQFSHLRALGRLERESFILAFQETKTSRTELPC